MNFKRILFLGLLVLIGTGAVVSVGSFINPATELPAQVSSSIPAIPVPVYTTSCTNLTRYLYQGSRDSKTNGEVTVLQKYFVKIGYLSADSVTGYFGPLTRKAVTRFQKDHNISQTGTVGPVTRATLGAINCTQTLTSGVPCTGGQLYNTQTGLPCTPNGTSTSSTGTTTTITTTTSGGTPGGAPTSPSAPIVPPPPPPAPPANTPPTVSAGTNQTITLPTNSTTLSGSASAGSGANIASYAWTQVSGPALATRSSNITPAITVSGLISGTYVFNLSATDSNSLTGSATVTVTVNTAVIVPPTNTPPVVSAGTNQTITLPTASVTLSGSATDNGTIATYAWSQVSGPNTATKSGASTATLVASGLIQGSYVFKLTATDNGGLSASSTATVTVNAAGVVNTPPVVSAGSNQTITLPTASVTLSGSATDNGTIASYLWSQVSGPSTATLANTTTATLAASNLVQGTYMFKLTATDNGGLSASSTATVTVNAAVVVVPPPPPPSGSGLGYNLSLPAEDGSGWTVIPATTSDSLVIYVSSSLGNDAWTGKLPAPNAGNTDGPKKTIASAASKYFFRLRTGHPDRLLLKAGDTFNENLGGLGLTGGASRTAPFVITSYGTGPQPVLNTGNPNAYVMIGVGVSDVWIIGLNFHCDVRDPSSPTFNATIPAIDGMYIIASNAISDILIEGNTFNYYRDALSIDQSGASSPISDLRVRRNVIANSYDLYTYAGQGMFTDNVNQLLVEENVFDYNGWRWTGSSITGQTVFGHNLYTRAIANGTIRNNIFARSSGVSTTMTADSAVKVVSNALMDNNLFVNVPYAFAHGDAGLLHTIQNSTWQNNVVTENSPYTGQTSGTGFESGSADGLTASSNYFVNGGATTGGETLGLNGLQHANVLYQNNVKYNWGGATYVPVPFAAADTVTTQNNQIELAGSLYVDPTRNVSKYDSTIGGNGTVVDFLSRARQQTKGNWNTAYTANAANAYIKAGFTLK